MPVSRAQIFYELPGGEKWSNVYHTDGDGLLADKFAWTSAGIPILAGLLHASCLITRVLVSDPDPDVPDFTESVVNVAGTSAFTDSRLPLFNCVKAFFQPDNLGKPDYKFYKGWLTEALNDSGQITSADADDFSTALSQLISDMDDAGAILCSENGDHWVSNSVQPSIQMRQMHRKRKKPVAP